MGSSRASPVCWMVLSKGAGHAVVHDMRWSDRETRGGRSVAEYGSLSPSRRRIVRRRRPANRTRISVHTSSRPQAGKISKNSRPPSTSSAADSTGTFSGKTTETIPRRPRLTIPSLCACYRTTGQRTSVAGYVSTLAAWRHPQSRTSPSLEDYQALPFMSY